MRIRRLFCFIFGHRLHVHQKFSSYSRRVICLHCDGDWGMNDNVPAFIPWDGELEEMYKSFGHRILIK